MSKKDINKSKELMSLEDVHTYLLYLLHQVNTISEKTGIPYFAHAGTLIGALRHQGFIPWDDDVDLLIERKYYDAFVKACEEYLPSQVVIRTLENDPSFCEEYIKICFKDEKRQYSELSVDVFILDETNPKRIFFRWLQNKIIRMIRPIKLYKISRIYSHMKPYIPHNYFKRYLLKIVSLLPLNFLTTLYIKTMKAEKHSTEYYVDWGSLSGYKRATRPKFFFEKNKKMPFENTYIYVSTMAEDMANFIFKKIPWRIVPPPEMRKTHNVPIIKNKKIDIEKIKDYVKGLSY